MLNSIWPYRRKQAIAELHCICREIRQSGLRVCFLLHGFNVCDDGAATIQQIRPFIDDEKMICVPINYGWRGVIGTRCHNKRTASILADLSEAGDVAVGHSNGCTIINMATGMEGCQIRRVAYIQPALDHWRFPRQCEWLVTSNDGDHATWISKWLAFHRWGDMGQVGYQKANDVPIADEMPLQIFTHKRGIRGHSTIFSSEGMKIYGGIIAKFVGKR